MKLPHAHLAVVEERKVRDYLLNVAHPDNSGKAMFFAAMGFTKRSWVELADALREHGGSGSVVKRFISSHGRKFVVEGELQTPKGKTPRIRSIWIIEPPSTSPRLITAYPAA